jgi:hypothetical protein
VKDCPLEYTSPNAPAKRDVLGTILIVGIGRTLAVCAHELHCESGVNPGLLGMTKVASEDSVRMEPVAASFDFGGY